MTDDSFTPERRRVVSWYNGAGWVTFCGVCGVIKGACNCGTTPAGTVSLPTQAESEPAPVEDTQAAPNEWDVCPKCKFVTLYCACAS